MFFNRVLMSRHYIIFMVLSIILAGCSGNIQRGPLDVKKVTYVEYGGDTNHVEMYVITSDHKVTQYSINPDKNYDYLAGELPPEDYYELKEYEMSEMSWTSMVNVLTRVNFMELKEDLSAGGDICDASSFYIKVETSDANHSSGGYAAGLIDDSIGRRFAEARQSIMKALDGN